MDNKQRKQINFRANEEIQEKLRILADQTQRTQSNWLRWIIDREWRELTATPLVAIAFALGWALMQTPKEDE